MEKAIPANSFKAQRLIHLAKEHKLQDQMKEKLLSAKFVEGKDIYDEEVLKAEVIQVGLDGMLVDALFASEDFSKAVRADEAQASQLGISELFLMITSVNNGVLGYELNFETLNLIRSFNSNNIF